MGYDIVKLMQNTNVVRQDEAPQPRVGVCYLRPPDPEASLKLMGDWGENGDDTHGPPSSPTNPLPAITLANSPPYGDGLQRFRPTRHQLATSVLEVLLA